jgi:hypothetical protein
MYHRLIDELELKCEQIAHELGTLRSQLKDLKQNGLNNERVLDLSEWNDLPMVLEPKHIQKVLGIGINQVLPMLKNDPPFFVIRLGNRYKVAKVSFFEWLTTGKKYS